LGGGPDGKKTHPGGEHRASLARHRGKEGGKIALYLAEEKGKALSFRRPQGGGGEGGGEIVLA